MTGNPPKFWDMIPEAAVHIDALMDLFRRACQRQGWTLCAERGLIGWAEVRCSAGHEFSVRAWDLVSGSRPPEISPSEPWCTKCRKADWVAECLTVLKSVAGAQGVELTATDERDKSGEGHIVFAAKCRKGHHFKATGAEARSRRGDPVDVLCPGCQQAAEFEEGFAKIEAVLRETRSTVVKDYSNAVDVRCRRGHSHTFRVDGRMEREAIRPDFCRPCSELAKFQELSEQAKDLGITVLESQWIAKSRAHRAVCFAGHEFGLIPNKMKRGCPECPPGMYGGAVPPHDVYYVVSGRDVTTGKETVKPGISSGMGYNRLRQHAEDGLTTQHLRIQGLPLGVARALETFVLAGLDREGWLSTRGVEYFPAAALTDVIDLAGEWFTDQPGLSIRPFVVDAGDILEAAGTPGSPDVVDLDVDTAVVFDSDDLRAVAALTR
ncbi:hypothetical protein [Streptomyces tendae]|uniref:hypothetical protein n=1 Tax=Streptomyces tendae TaxID=1932 RepID=UPI00249376E0|nr:hypothetical protein [Streptomyces tendae]